VATVSRIDKIIGLSCRILSLSLGSFAKETYNSIDPTNQSHPIPFARSQIILEYDLTLRGSAMFLSHGETAQLVNPPYATTTSNRASDPRVKPKPVTYHRIVLG